jgi:hypothetical protein
MITFPTLLNIMGFLFTSYRCCAVLCCAVLCYAVLCCAVLTGCAESTWGRALQRLCAKVQVVHYLRRQAFVSRPVLHQRGGGRGGAAEHAGGFRAHRRGLEKRMRIGQR